MNHYGLTVNQQQNQGASRSDLLKGDSNLSESLNLFLQAYNEVITNKVKKINPIILRTLKENGQNSSENIKSQAND